MPIDIDDLVFRPLFRRLADNLLEGLYFLDRDRKIAFWNQAAASVTGYGKDEVIGCRCRDDMLVHVDEEGRCLCESDGCPAVRSMETDEIVEGSVYFHHKDGHRVRVRTRTIPVHDASRRVVGAIQLFEEDRSVGPGRELDELRRLSMLDPLTGVGNRRYVEVHLANRIEEMRRFGTPFGVVFCDVDDLKRLNDRYGHKTGDHVIKAVAQTIVRCVRPFDYVGRWGGDEFLAIVANVQPWQLYAIAERLRVLVLQTFVAAETMKDGTSERSSTSISIGATLARPEDDQDSLFERADKNLHRSKAAGKNVVVTDDGP